ncbi:hypothetical protein P186_2545 [Pyrobaculum ferrireducens]|uniref:Uncharacterized protein n=1 Tax=Pyrobaculum ferrireducens TaxID=1104324 RepID=G7VD52_9CREN|nr:hypothetical protein P186_2545 [Pyrobaculum ferrireducens]
MRKKYFVVTLILIFLLISYIYGYDPFWFFHSYIHNLYMTLHILYINLFVNEKDVCFVNFDVSCTSVGNISGVVYGPCEYGGVVEAPRPVEARNFRCVAAGRVGNKTAVVFVGKVVTGYPDPEAPFDLHLKQLCANKRGFYAFPLALVGYDAVYVIYPEDGVGYLTFAYNYMWFNHTHFLFTSDGVYVKALLTLPVSNRSVALETGVKTEVMGQVLRNCAYRLLVPNFDMAKLKVGAPLYNTSGFYIKVG